MACNPVALGHGATKALFDPDRILGFRRAERRGQSADMRIHDQPDGDLERRAEDDIRGLAGHAGQRQQLVHRARDLTAERQRLRPKRDNQLRLAA